MIHHGKPVEPENVNDLMVYYFSVTVIELDNTLRMFPHLMDTLKMAVFCRS